MHSGLERYNLGATEQACQLTMEEIQDSAKKGYPRYSREGLDFSEACMFMEYV